MGEKNSQELVVQTLSALIEKAHKNDNKISWDEVITTFDTFELTAEQANNLYNTIEAQDIEIINSRDISEEPGDEGEETVELLIDAEEEVDDVILEGEAEEVKIEETAEVL